MQTVNIRQAKTHLSRLVDKAVKGEIWPAGDSERSPDRLRALIEDEQNELFSAPTASGKSRSAMRKAPIFAPIPRCSENALLQDVYVELPINGEHALAIAAHSGRSTRILWTVY